MPKVVHSPPYLVASTRRRPAAVIMLLRRSRCLPAALSRAAAHPRVSPAATSPGPPPQHGQLAVANQGSVIEARSGPIDRVRGSMMARANLVTLLPASIGGRHKVGMQTRWFSSTGLPPHMVIGLPALSPTMNQGNITKWRKQEGDKIKVGDMICEIETDKATLEFESPEEGYLGKILVPDGSKDVQVGQPIFSRLKTLLILKRYLWIPPLEADMRRTSQMGVQYKVLKLMQLNKAQH